MLDRWPGSTLFKVKGALLSEACIHQQETFTGVGHDHLFTQILTLISNFLLCKTLSPLLGISREGALVFLWGFSRVPPTMTEHQLLFSWLLNHGALHLTDHIDSVYRPVICQGGYYWAHYCLILIISSLESCRKLFFPNYLFLFLQ